MDLDFITKISNIETAKDAIKLVIRGRRRDADVGNHFGYDIHIGSLVDRSFSGGHLRILPLPVAPSPEEQEVSSLFMDAAWELALAGYLRPGPSVAQGQKVFHGDGLGYSLTRKGEEEWLFS